VTGIEKHKISDNLSARVKSQTEHSKRKKKG